MEELAPGRSSFMTPELTVIFSAIQKEIRTIAGQKTTSTSQVITVDMFTRFTDGMLADNVHYNEIGAEFIATR
jgi:hypothetical protein